MGARSESSSHFRSPTIGVGDWFDPHRPYQPFLLKIKRFLARPTACTRGVPLATGEFPHIGGRIKILSGGTHYQLARQTPLLPFVEAPKKIRLGEWVESHESRAL